MTRKRKGVWSEEENSTLRRLVNEQLGTEAATTTADVKSGHSVSSTLRGASVTTAERVDWLSVSDAIGTRTRKQCRERWVNFLDPQLKQCDWSPVEDATLLILGYDFCPKQWAVISRALPGRPPNHIRARWYSLQKIFYKFDEQLEQQNVTGSLLEAKQILEKPSTTNADRTQLHFH